VHAAPGSGDDAVATVKTALAVFPSLVPTTLVVPEVSAVIRPAAVTDATFADELLQDTVRPVKIFPAESLSVAVAWDVAPTAADAGLNATVIVDTDAGADEGAWLVVATAFHFWSADP